MLSGEQKLAHSCLRCIDQTANSCLM